MRQKINLQTILIILGVLVMCLGVGYLVFVWTERTTVPLGGNVPAPLNVSTAPQVVPNSLSATIVSATQINLVWLDNSADETGFEIERCTGAGCTAFALVHTTGANVTTWSNTGLAGGTLHRYRVRAINAVGNSTFSNIAEATTQTFNWIFVTSTTHTGNLGGLAGGDAICAARAREAGLDGTFRAWLSSETVSARDRLVHSAWPYVRIDGVRVADNFAGLTSGRLLAPINVRETGNLILGAIDFDVWTGTGTTGMRERFVCDGWLTSYTIDEEVESYGVPGWSEKTDQGWTHYAFTPCNFRKRLYCLQQ
ncbi:MAG: hypothetical protein DDT40_01920 [candidate division WS2 bacterium]|nr:hypothetical protein [Candidatus Psychracetigena formicireducens]